MFEIGDRVAMADCKDANGNYIFGRIIGYHYDEGNVWEVRVDDGSVHDCCDDDIEPASWRE